MMASDRTNPYSHLVESMPPLAGDSTPYVYYSLVKLNDSRLDALPYCIRILLESAVRNCDNFQVREADVENILAWQEHTGSGSQQGSEGCGGRAKDVEVAFKPARVLLQDFTGVPAVVDLAAMRDAVHSLGGDPLSINPVCPADLVIDHSVQVDVTTHRVGTLPHHHRHHHSTRHTRHNHPSQHQPTCQHQCSSSHGDRWKHDKCISRRREPHHLPHPPAASTYTGASEYISCPFHHLPTHRADALTRNQELEFERNKERFMFLKWGAKAFNNMLIVPPGSGIVHQVNLEYLGRLVFSVESDVGEGSGERLLYPDSLVGTDSHTTMINGLGILGWGVGGIEAEAVMLGQAISLVLPQVIGYRITGELGQYVTSTDLVLTVTKHLREVGVVGKFVEFYGPGVRHLSIADRATISNMCPEYGATVGYFTPDAGSVMYMRQTGRSDTQIAYIEAYLKANRLFRDYTDPAQDPSFTQVVELDLSSIVSSVSGPKRPHDRVSVDSLKQDFTACLSNKVGFKGYGIPADQCHVKVPFTYSVDSNEYSLSHGDVVIAAITSCTNTSNPSVMLAAGLLAQRAVEAGLAMKPYIKTSLSPGSGVVTHYLNRSGTLPYLTKLGFDIVGYGCMTCIGNSGPLDDSVAEAIEKGDVVVCGVLSGNRNFEGRIHPLTRANYLASPPLVIAYALAGTVSIDFLTQPLGVSSDGKEVFLKDIWPTRAQVQEYERQFVIPSMFKEVYDNIQKGSDAWSTLDAPDSALYPWDPSSTYIQRPPFFDNLSLVPSDTVEDIRSAHVLLHLGDSVTTDHISPAGSIARNSAAARYLTQRGLYPREFNSYGSRRGNDAVMSRGTFANIRLVNKFIGKASPHTVHLPSGEQMDVYDAAMRYREEGIPVIVLAGKEYGSGSSRDWAAKGPCLLGIRAVLAESYERIHRSNLIGMGIIPLEYLPGQSAQVLELNGTERYTVQLSTSTPLTPRCVVNIQVSDGRSFQAVARFDTDVELTYFKHGGILNFMIRKLMKQDNTAV